MANFQTHLNGGILVSAVATLSLQIADLVQDGQVMVLFILGVVGSLLPDIDSNSSKPVRGFFSVLGVGLAFAMTLPLTARLGPLVLAGLWIGVYLFVRYGLFEIFTRLTVHRGIWHSWLGIAVALLTTTNLAYWIWDQSPEPAWIAGLMVGIGYLTHLVLDELFSVDLVNARLKRSFGTALKPFSSSSPWSSLAMMVVIAILAWLAPSPDSLLVKFDADQLLDRDAVLARIESALNWSLAQMNAWWSRMERLLDLA